MRTNIPIENKALPFENGQEFNDFQHLTPMIWIFLVSILFSKLKCKRLFYIGKTQLTITSFIKYGDY
jgi:hypothetical protein